MQSGKQSHHEWYGLRFRPSTVVWTGEGVFKRMLLCVWFGPERAASQWLEVGMEKLGVKCRRPRANWNPQEKALTFSSLPTSNLNEVGNMQGEAGNLLCQTTHVLGGGRRAGRRGGAGAGASEVQLQPLATWGTSRSAPTGGAAVGPLLRPCGCNGPCFTTAFQITQKCLLQSTLSNPDC